jgi:anti-sigma factor RsiW
MNVAREVIVDLLPVYLSGEASPATRSLVEEYMKQDAELAQRVRLQWADSFAKLAPSAPPPELELRSLRRARRLLNLQKWLLGLGIGFIACSLSFGTTYENRRFRGGHFFLPDHPLGYGTCMALGLACWIGYLIIRRRLRATAA